MTTGPHLARLVSGASLVGLAVMTLTLAVAAGTAAPSSPTPGAFLPVIYAPPKPTPTGTPLPVTPPSAHDWQTVLVYYRASAHLPALAVNGDWSTGAANHAHYMVSNDVLAYTEGTATPWYSAAGATEAANSDLMLSDNVATTDQQALDFWMSKPFHALGLLNPALLATGFGSYRHDAGPFDPYRMGAVIDVRQGLGAIPGSVRFPVKWPEANATVYLTRYDGNEQPDPLTSCPGYTAPSGLPIIVQVGPGGSNINVTAASFAQGSTALAYCVFGPGSYDNPLSDYQNLGRQILAASDAVVLIPQQPLTPGLSYTVTMTVNGQAMMWTFNVTS